MEGCQKLLNMRCENEVSEEQGLELTLGPPGYICKSQNNNQNENSVGVMRGFLKTVEANSRERKWVTNSDEIHSQKLIASHKRVAPAPVVGWPPVRSFRKNLAHGSSAKSNPSSLTESSEEVMKRKSECSKNGLFVKINMDGVPIGRKIDLNAYESYENLSYAIDELFRGLLAAQGECLHGRGENDMMETKIPELGFKRDEYTLVYEDNEGDRMLVGDVPWNMFVSAAKRLRVLRTSDLSTLRLGSNKQVKDGAT